MFTTGWHKLFPIETNDSFLGRTVPIQVDFFFNHDFEKGARSLNRLAGSPSTSSSIGVSCGSAKQHKLFYKCSFSEKLSQFCFIGAVKTIVCFFIVLFGRNQLLFCFLTRPEKRQTIELFCYSFVNYPTLPLKRDISPYSVPPIEPEFENLWDIPQLIRDERGAYVNGLFDLAGEQDELARGSSVTLL